MYCMREEVNQTQLVGFNVFGIGSEEASWAAVVKIMGFTRCESRTRLIMHLVDNAWRRGE